MRKIGDLFATLALAMGGRAVRWGLLRWAKAKGWDAVDAARITDRELAALPRSLEAHFVYQKSEQDVLTERLSRRYDVGMAMNEAANRAIEAKKAARQEADPTGGLTGRQLAALEFQKQFLQRVVDQS